LSAERLAFWLTALFAGATVWIAPRLPLADLPQHAGQIALWHDLLLGTSKWQSLVQVNYFTPYLVGCGLAVLLSFVMPVSGALKLLLALSYYGFILGCVALRRGMGADRRLDWLSVTGFFGLAYLYGFFPFLIALPIGLAFMVLAQRHANGPTLASGTLLAVTGLVLFFTHGLVFVFANVVGVAFLLLRRRSFASLLAAALPYAALGALCLVYVFGRQPEAESVAMSPEWPGLFNGVNHLLFFPMGMPGADLVLAPLVPLLLGVPWLLGCRINWSNKAAFVPLAALLLWVVAVPETVMATFFVVSRFAVFLLPFYTLMFLPPQTPRMRPAWVMAAVAAISWIFLAVEVERLTAFARESASFDEVLAEAAPGHRALQLVQDVGSEAARTPMAYTNFPLWYQAGKQGLVDFNFAQYAAQVVRYRDPRAARAMPIGGYRYFFVRSTKPLPTPFFPSGACQPMPRKNAGPWTLFEAVNC
jgi:hypothetical protein